MDRVITGWSVMSVSCSPHTRGWTEAELNLQNWNYRLFPAHAGMDRLPAHAGMDRIAVTYW